MEKSSAISIKTWSSALLSQSGLLHFFTTRLGGVSPAPFDSLNLGLTTKDDPENVAKNRRRVEKEFNVTLQSLAGQVHGNNVLVIKSEKQIPRYARNDRAQIPRTPLCGGFAPPKRNGVRNDKDGNSPRPNADAIVSNIPNLTIAMFFADCLPVYFWDPATRSGGLAHAGWRGTIAGIVSSTVEALILEFNADPKNLQAAIGPSIGPCCFEVKADVAEQFVNHYGEEIIRQEAKRTFVDLQKINRMELRRKGLQEKNIVVANECTSCTVERYYSYRRDRGETGRMAGVLKLPS